MRVSTVLRIALCTTGIAVALLAGCGTLQPSIGAPDRMLQTRATTADADRSESWMKPNASKALLYFDDDITNDTYVYDYPSGKLVGKLTGFHDPQGMCVDPKGDVYITNPQYGLLFEYAHGGVKPINIYERPGVGLNGCSVSATVTLPLPVGARSASGRAASRTILRPALTTTRASAARDYRRSATTTRAILLAWARAATAARLPPA